MPAAGADAKNAAGRVKRHRTFDHLVAAVVVAQQ